MIGIEAVASELGSVRVLVGEGESVAGGRRGVDDGFQALARRRDGQEASDLCVLAAAKLLANVGISASEIGCVVVVTQHPDGYGVPHVGSIAQAKLGVPDTSPSFDVGLGGSGYVYGLSILKGFMQLNGVKRGLLLTADPISRVIGGGGDRAGLTFGDAGTASLLSDSAIWEIGRFDFGNTVAKSASYQVRLRMGGRLYVDSRTIGDVFAQEAPGSIRRALSMSGAEIEDIDRIIVQQLNRPVVDSIGRTLKAPTKTAFYASEYGDTGSSSIPIVLSSNVNASDNHLVLSGFGAGLSWASTTLHRIR